MKKTIKFYRATQYGNVREFVHPENAAESAIIAKLTGQKTMNSQVRQLICDLSRGQIDFLEVIAP